MAKATSTENKAPGGRDSGAHENERHAHSRLLKGLSAESEPAAGKGKSGERSTRISDDIIISNGTGRRRGWCRRLCKWVLMPFMILLMVLMAVLYYFLGTLNGARQALDIANAFIPESIIIDTTIQSGSVLEGLQLGETLVDIKDIVAINADSLVLDYDLTELTSGMFKVHTLEASNLGVALYDQLFNGPKAPEEPVDPNEPPFRLSFPVDIEIDNFHISDFAFRSMIVDVEINDLQSALWAHKDNLGTRNTDVDVIDVHLKNFNDVAYDQQQAQAAALADQQLAISIDGNVLSGQKLEDSVAALVQAAQQGKSVEMLLVHNEQQRRAQRTEDKLLGSLDSQFAGSAEDTGAAGATGSASVAGSGFYQRHDNSDASMSNARRVNDSLSLLRPGLVYSDPELFADAMESALLNRAPVPAFVNLRPAIVDPRTSPVALKESVTRRNSDDFESSLLDKVNAHAAALAASHICTADSCDHASFNTALSAAPLNIRPRLSTDLPRIPATFAPTDITGVPDHPGSSAPATWSEKRVARAAAAAAALAAAADAGTGSVGDFGAGAAGYSAPPAADGEQAAAQDNAPGSADPEGAVSVESGFTSTSGAVARAAGKSALAAVAEANRQVSDGKSSGNVDVDAVSGSTASSVAQAARLMTDERSQKVVAKAIEGENPKALIKEFGSGDGRIETLAKVVLPFNIEVDNFNARKVRYYQEGFDTRQADISFNASWFDTNLKIYNIDLSHEFGTVHASGDLDLNNYYDLNFVLEGEGFKNDITHDFMQGLLYGLNGDFRVSGNLTDLKVRSTLNLGGTSELNVHANVLSAALPITVSLRTRDFTWPVFGDPLVNARSIDLHTAGNLLDGVDVDLKALISGFDFKNVKSDVKAQISYEKSHIEKFEVNGTYLGEPVKASVRGDFFYGKVLGADARVFAQVKDAGFLSPMLKGALKIDGDFVAILNQKETGRSAVSIASEPAYLDNRIPKSAARIEDFDADTIEQRLFAQIRSGSVSTSGNTTVLNSSARGKSSRRDSGAAAAGSSTGGAGAGAAGRGGRGATVVAATADSAEEQLLAGISANIETARHVATSKAVDAVRSGQSLAAVRPISKPYLLADGVPDGPYDMLITRQEYIDAVRFVNEAAPEDAADDQDNFLRTVISRDLPEIMTNIRHIRGDLFINGHQASLNITDVVGDIHQGFRVELIKFTHADNVILAEGQVTGRGADLNLIVDLKDLHKLSPAVHGSMSAYVTSSGNLSDLNFDISGSVPVLSTGESRIRSLVFNSSFNMQTRALNFTALADRVRWSKSVAPSRQCFIDVSGTPLRHSISANCSGVAAAYVNVDGSLDFPASRYNANLLELYFFSESSGSLSLVNPVYAEIDYGNIEGHITPVELKGEIGELKIAETTFTSTDARSHLTVQNFNLNSLKDLFPDSIKMQVPLNVDASLLMKNGKPDIKVAVNSDKGVVFSTAGAGFVYDHMALNAHITRELMHTELDIDLRNNRGQIDAVLDISDPAGAGRLGGFFRIKDFDLESISNIGQSFTELKGFTNVDTVFAGTIARPMVHGTITSKGSAVPRYDVGQVNDFDLTMKLNGQSGVLDGKVVLNGGELKLGGDLDWSSGANGSLFARAKELPVFLVGYGIAYADIDTSVKLGDIMDISGTVNIPRAAISVASAGSSGTSVSSDEILVPVNGTQALMKAPSAPFKSSINIGVGFGDDVRFTAMGMVKGNLGGGIRITKKVSDAAVKANGEINVIDGTADIYGRKFEFAHARIMFFDDIADPNLNIEVVADPDYLESDVTVGARVLGTANSPEIKLFSRPVMSENEILSYILYGHGLDKTSINQDSNNSNMLLGLGVSGLSGVAQAVAGSFGVQDVQLATQGTGDEMQVAVQGYINRRLRLSYGYGVFSAVGEFKVRYELVRNLYAEFVSSIDQAVDLVYSFEFD